MDEFIAQNILFVLYFDNGQDDSNHSMWSMWILRSLENLRRKELINMYYDLYPNHTFIDSGSFRLMLINRGLVEDVSCGFLYLNKDMDIDGYIKKN